MKPIKKNDEKPSETNLEVPPQGPDRDPLDPQALSTQPTVPTHTYKKDRAKVINFFGKRGAGKTTVIRGQLLDCRPPVVVIDILGNFQNPNYFQSESLSQTITEISNQLKNDKYKIIVLKTPDPNLAVDYLSATLWEVEGGTLVLDEIDAFNISESPCFDQLIRYGRNKNISIITGCRRPAEVSRNITAAANQMYAMKTNEPRDIDYFSQTIFGEYAYELMRLPEFHGLYVDYDLSEKGIFRFDINGHIFKLKSDAL